MGCMGHHFVPQAYLRAFQSPNNPGMIWVYPRNGDPRLASIKNVAQASDFYDEDVERELNALVEAPANPFLDRLRRSEFIDADGKYRVSVYIATMLKRVPRSRERGEAMIPKSLEITVSELRNELTELAAEGSVEPQRLQTWLSQVDAAYLKYKDDPPQEVLDQLRIPWPTAKMVNAIRGMQWRILVARSPEMFITSDNPGFFFEAYGLVKEHAEVCLALSPTHCLHCCHQRIPEGDVAFMFADRETPREINRRIASAATSIVMGHEKQPWPTKLLRKQNPYLSRINWTN